MTRDRPNNRLSSRPSIRNEKATQISAPVSVEPGTTPRVFHRLFYVVFSKIRHNIIPKPFRPSLAHFKIAIFCFRSKTKQLLRSHDSQIIGQQCSAATVPEGGKLPSITHHAVKHTHTHTPDTHHPVAEVFLYFI